MEIFDNTEIKARPLYQGLIGAAVVAAVFAVIAAVLLAITGYRITGEAPKQAGKLRAMQEQLQTRSFDAALTEQIRTVDEQIRRDELRCQRFIETGGLYFAGSTLVAVICFMATRVMLRPAPIIPAEESCSGLQIQQAMRVRLAVTVVVVLLAATGLYVILKLTPKSTLPASATTPAVSPKADWAAVVKGQWPSFRGPWGLGVIEAKDIPDVWNEKQKQGILWKSEVPLVGHSSPIVWNDRIFIAGATATEQKLFCYDAKDGKLLWTGQVKPAGTENREPLDVMKDTGYAACTPITNGQTVFTIFATGDVGCFDMNGKLLWQKALGVPESAYGYAASPTVLDTMAMVQFDQGFEEGKSELIAFNLADGAIVWRTKRPTPNTWTSPTIVKMNKGYQILTSGSPWVIGYEPFSGKELWRVECLGSDIAPTQIFVGGLVLAIQPYDKLYAIRTEDPNKVAIAWSVQGDMPDICSPVSDSQLVWILTTVGGLTCFDLSNGSEVYTQSLEGEFNASPSLVGDKLYILSRKGEMIIAQAGREFKELGRCAIDEDCFASPAFTDGRIYLRSDKSLYCIGKAP
jgi:outer membrane protein assembly factor BamB